MSGRYQRDFTDAERRRGHAARIGCTPEEYEVRRADGQKWCHHCRNWHDRGEFGANRSTHDGLQAMCRDAKRTYQRAHKARRARVTPRPTPRPVPPPGDLPMTTLRRMAIPLDRRDMANVHTTARSRSMARQRAIRDHGGAFLAGEVAS